MPAITKLRSKSGPAAHIPADILEIIFMLLVQDEKASTTFTQRTAPLIISGVCQHWRDVALHRKSLWSSFIADMSSATSISQHVMHFSCFLERCGSVLPIDLAVTASGDDGNTASVITNNASSARSDSLEEKSQELVLSFSVLAMERCMGVLIPHHAQWRDVKLAFPRSEVSTDIMGLTQPMILEGMTSLRNLHIDFPSPTRLEHATLDLSGSQLMERAHVSGFIRIDLGPHVALPNLTHLSLNLPPRQHSCVDRWRWLPISERWVFRALEQMPNLTSLTVVINRGSPLSDWHDDEPPVTLANLKHLEVICKGIENYGSDRKFIESISCPSLQELIISSTVYSPVECRFCIPVDDNRPRFFPSMHSPLTAQFIRLAGRTLEKLAFNCNYLIDENLTEALTLCPGLRHLFVSSNRQFMDRAVISMFKHERVECAIAHSDLTTGEILYDFSSPDYPVERLFSNTVTWFEFCPKY